MAFRFPSVFLGLIFWAHLAFATQFDITGNEIFPLETYLTIIGVSADAPVSPEMLTQAVGDIELFLAKSGYAIARVPASGREDEFSLHRHGVGSGSADHTGALRGRATGRRFKRPVGVSGGTRTARLLARPAHPTGGTGDVALQGSQGCRDLGNQRSRP